MPNQDAINAMRQFEPRPTGPSQYQPATPQNLGNTYGFDNMQPQPYPGYTANRFWDNPERLTRYLDAAAAVPEGAEMPDWLSKAVPVLTEARSYFEKANPGKSWWEWSELADDDPMKQALRTLAPPPTYAMYDEEQGEDWYNIPRGGAAGTMETGAMPDTPAPTTGGGGGIVPAGYQPAENVTQDLIFGYTPEAWDALPKEQQLMMQIMPAVQRGMAVASGVVIGAGVAGPVGAVAGGLGGLGLAVGAEKNPGLAKAMSVLDLPREILERTMGVLYQGYAEGLAAYKDGGMGASQDAVADVLNNLPAAWKAAHEFYNIALAGSTVDAEGNRVYGGVFSNDPNNKRVIYGTEGAQEITAGNTMRELQAMREAIANGTATPEQVYADLEARYGAGGMMREIVSGFVLDPLNVLPGSIKDVGSGLAGKLGNAPLKTALESNKTLLGGIQEYGTALRQLPIEEASHYGVVSKWLAGLDDTGQIKDYAKVANEPNKLKAAFNYLTGLTPMARATEVVNNSAESLKLMLGEDNLTDIETYQTAKALTSVSIEGVVDGAETTRLPKYFTSAEAQPLALALRSKGKEVDAIWDRYRMARPQAEMLQRMAKVMERSDAELLDTLKAATPEDADLVLREFKAALKARADGGDKDAGAILEGIGQDRNMTGATLKRWADAFKRPDGPAYNKSILQMQLVTMFEEGVEKWTVDWFGVKPQHWFFRMNDVMKKAQSYLLLGLSPSYFMNNAINNLVTTGWDGLLSFHTAKARKNMLAEFGIQPSRFSAANTAADVADNTGGRILREASTQPGNLQAVSDFLDKGRKIQVASRLSQVSERFSGENAMLTAMLQYWSSHWKPGKGFDKLPQGLRNVLEQVQPGLSKKIENAVSGSKNRAAVEKAIFAELGKRRVTDLFTPDDRETLAHFPGLLDGIERGLDKATTQEQRRQVFQDARTSMEKQIDADVARNVRRLTEETTNRVVTEGVQSVIDMGYQIAEARADMHWQHRSRLDDLWRSVQGKTGFERRMILENGLAAEDRLWNAHQNVEGARILGMVKGMGADDPQMLAVERSLMDQHDLWASYFAEKRRMIEEFYNTTFEDDAASNAAWRALNDKLDDMYVDRLEGEAGAQAIINGVFADAGERQWEGSRSSFEKWTNDIQHQHEQIGEAVRYFRTGKSKAIDPDVKKLVDDIRKGEKPVDQISDPAIRDALWKEFNQYGYNVLVRRQLDAVNGGSARILNEPGSYARAIQQGKAEGQVPKANAQPAAVPVMVTQNMKRQLADLGYSAEDVRLMKPQDAWDIINAQTAKAVDAIIESAPNTDNRQNSWLRKAIDEMDFEERGEVINWLRNRIMTDERTGMKNMVAYLEAERKPNAVAVDITGLKTVNDTWGEANGDILIKAYAKLLNDITEDSYRLHGDLFLLQADNPAMAAEMLANVQTAVDNLIIEVIDAEGQTHYLTGFDIHGAVGTGYENASAGLKASKPARTATGEDRRLVNRVHEIEPKGEDRGGVAERAVEPEVVSPYVEKQRTAIRERVQEYDPSVTADRHILNIVKKYGGYAITRFDQITTEMVQNAFARRSIERRAAGQASDIDARIVQARTAALEENMTRLELSAPKEYTREAWSRDLYDMMPEQADGVIAVTDAIADHWAQENGKTRDAWYNTFLLERGGTEAGEGLFQIAPAVETPEFKRWFDEKGIKSEDGSPEDIYHFSPIQDINEFARNIETGDSNAGVFADIGLFLTRDNRFQASYSGHGMEEPYQFYVRGNMFDTRVADLQNTADEFLSSAYGDIARSQLLDTDGLDWDGAVARLAEEMRKGKIEQIGELLESKDFTDWVKSKGYDGVDTGGNLIVFEPWENVKSVLNKGTFDPNNPNILKQGIKGSTRWLDNGKAVIRAFESADVSTIVHEVAHVWMDQLGEGDRGIVSRWLKQQGADIADVKGKELFARGFERYLAEGKAPTPKLASVFANFKRWMLDIYKAITGSDIDIKLNDEVRGMFDRWMGKEAEVVQPPQPAAPSMWDAGKPKVEGEQLPTIEAKKVEENTPTTPGMLFQTAPDPRPAIGAPLGIVDGLHLPPIEEAAIEGYMRDIRPLLDRAERAADEPDFDVALPEPAQKEIRRWLGGVYNQMADTKMGMMRYGEARRDFALLNYTRRHGVDNYIGAIMPYQFWYTRSALNWAIRAMTNPAIAANYYRLSRTTNGMQEQEGYPTRLRGKMGIKVPFLPDWMGEGVYIDPYKQAFPFAQMLRPWQKREEDMSMLARKVQSNLDRMIEDEEITPAQYEQAISTHAGQVWQRATAEAERDMDSDSLNMGDFMNTIMSYSLPIEVTRRMMSGEKDKIGQLPVTRTVQNLTAALGIGGARGVNIEAPFRKAMGMPEIDRFEETGINKLIADIVAEPGSSYSAQDALQAMIDREGPIYDEAQRRAGKVDLLKWVGSSLGVDLFPEGEQIQRQLQVEYYNAVEAWKGGDQQAINAFYDKYPEYEARAKAFKDPETQLRTFLISQIWQQYNDLPALSKREATDQLGGLFMDAFLNKETRSYDSISVNQLATWAKSLNGVAPKKAGEVSPYPLKFTDEKDAGAYQDYVDQRAAKWEGIDEVQAQYYDLPEASRRTFERQHPELTRYNEWRTRYLGDHLEVVPYVVGEESELYGYPADVQKQVYAYRAAKLRQYPGIDRLQEGYFAIDEIDKVGRRAYLKANPEIEAFWDWQQQQAADHPQAAQFIKSEGWMSEALGNYSASGVPKELQGALDSYYSQKEQAFPDIDQAWQQYMGLDTSARRAYWQQHPELQDYLDWQKIQIAANPGIISYVKSDESIANLVLPEKAGAIYPDDTLQATIARFSSSLAAQMLGAAYAGRSLGSGAKMELKRHYQEAGSPGNYDEWLEAIKAGIAP